MEALVVIVLWFLLSVGVGILAASRGRSATGYFFLAIFTSPILSLIIVLITKNINAENDNIQRAAYEHERQLESIKAIARSTSGNTPPTTDQTATNSFSVADELIKLGALKEKGLLTEDEFSQQKQLLLAKS